MRTGSSEKRGRPTKKDYIVEEVRSMIRSGDLARGERIHQDALAEQFNTSITPVREALRQLEAEGLLDSSPHRGVRVSETSAEAQDGVYVARRLLESFATQLAAQRFTRRDIARAREMIEEMRVAGEAGDSAAVRRINRDFHFLIYERAGIPSLLPTIDNLWLSFPWDTTEVLDPQASKAVDEHAAILDAIEQGKSADAGAALGSHLRRSYHDLVEKLSGSPLLEDPFDEVEASW
jgi:DNA-binding GntR family transcriptional regulator